MSDDSELVELIRVTTYIGAIADVNSAFGKGSPDLTDLMVTSAQIVPCELVFKALRQIASSRTRQIIRESWKRLGMKASKS